MTIERERIERAAQAMAEKDHEHTDWQSAPSDLWLALTPESRERYLGLARAASDILTADLAAEVEQIRVALGSAHDDQQALRDEVERVQGELAAVTKAAQDDDHDLLALSLTWIQGDQPGDWNEDYLAWYHRKDWPLGEHRAVTAFLAGRFREMATRLATAERERDAAREALGFYANEKHYRQRAPFEPADTEVNEDGGDRARAALKEAK